MSKATLGPSAHIDTFTRDNLPPPDQRPDFLPAGIDYPERLNIAVELTDRMVQKGFGDNTALIGKWLNGYGARDAHGEVPKGFDIWRGLLDVSAYDYYNFVMNQNGKLKTWGDRDFAMKLVKFAKIEVERADGAGQRAGFHAGEVDRDGAVGAAEGGLHHPHVVGDGKQQLA